MRELFPRSAPQARIQDGGSVLAGRDGDGRDASNYRRDSGEPELRLKTIFSTEDAATKAARKELAKIKQTHTFRASMVGRFVAVGSPLKVEDFPKQLDRDYQVVSATHSYGRGYTTEIEAEGE